MGDFDCDYKDYRSIGTTEECRIAVKKQEPMKPKEKESTEKTHYCCNNCNFITLTIYADGYRLGNAPKYCERCGQAFDWSDVD